MPHQGASGEGDAANTRWDPGPYITAVREDLVSAFASTPSLPPAFQGTNPSARPLRIQEVPSLTPPRTPIHGRPIILRDLHKHSSSLLTQEETSRLLRSLTQRDIAILQALHDYRYLNTSRFSSSSSTGSAPPKCGCSFSPITGSSTAGQ
jgi:hypothetical protein